MTAMETILMQTIMTVHGCSYKKKKCFLTRSISRLDNKEGKNLKTNLSPKQVEQIAKCHNSLLNNKRKVTVSLKAWKKKNKSNVF